MNKTYRKKPTRQQRIVKHQRQIILLGIIVTLTAILSIFQAYHLIKLTKALPSYTAIKVAKLNDQSIEDYVLEQVKEADLDPYKAYVLISCESRWNDQAININNGGAYGLDLGLWQISTKYHSEVSPKCSFDYKCQTKEAIRILKERGFQEWECGKIYNL